jgi:AraC-like DNA-binding protein
MDASLCSPYPHHAWLAHWVAVKPPRIFEVHECRHVTHHIMLTVKGAADVHWTTRGIDTAFHAAVSGLGFFPCDREMHSMAITAADGFNAYDLLIPDQHLRHICLSEGVQPSAEFPAVPVFRDELMEACLLRLSTKAGGHQVSEDIGDEIAARQVILQLCQVIGARRPDWYTDSSVFVPVVMRQIVECIDANLATQLSLENIAQTVGLSPGHFARKFRHSVGQSLGRFMNTRRVGMSFAMLREDTAPLASIAIDLGFSSQSHFTRLFSSLTGIAPQRFRRLHARMDT